MYNDIKQKRCHISNKGYAVSNGIYMHRYIMKYIGENVVDHINGDRLDNRMEI